MKTALDCLPCLLRQSMDAVRLCGATPATTIGYAREILLAATSLDFGRPPPLLAGVLQARVCEITGCADPFHEAKQRFTQLALELLPDLDRTVRGSADPFAAAVSLAIAGNVIDLGAKSGLTPAEVRDAVRSAFVTPVLGVIEDLRTAVRQARNILYLADNAGEIVFDRVLVNQLPRDRVTLAVRGRAVLNDATCADALAAGFGGMVEIMDNGSTVPGTALATCSPQFRARFAAADLILAKGQGNFETLHDSGAPVFSLFRVKCPIVAAHCGHPVGSHVVWRAPAVGQAEVVS